MLAVVEPLQDRSRRTYEAILEATEALLREKSFEEITVLEIVRTGGVSIGSFYARFASKESLLPVLYQRYEERISKRAAELSGEIERARTLLDACLAVTRSLAGVFQANPNLMRAIILLARSNPDRPRELSPRRREIHAAMEQALLRFRRTAPAERLLTAIRTAVFSVVCALRESILYPHAPFAVASGGAPEIESSLAAMMAAFLEREL
jgi:AcrR family transcriptional regulator